MKNWQLAALAAFIVAAISYYHFFYPPNVLRRETSKALETFSLIVESRDRTKISAGFQEFLADDAAIHLEVNFFQMVSQNGKPAVVQDFTKATFIPFIDNLLYSLSEYNYAPTLESFTLADDGQSAAVTFTSTQSADGKSYYGGLNIDMRFSSNATCQGKVSFATKTPRLTQASCAVHLRSVPKSGQAEKMQNTESLQQLLREQR